MRTHAKTDLQKLENLGKGETGPLCGYTFDLVSTGRFALPETRPRKDAACSKQTGIKSNKKSAVPPILGRINAHKFINERYKTLQLPTKQEQTQARAQV